MAIFGSADGDYLNWMTLHDDANLTNPDQADSRCESVEITICNCDRVFREDPDQAETRSACCYTITYHYNCDGYDGGNGTIGNSLPSGISFPGSNSGGSSSNNNNQNNINTQVEQILKDCNDVLNATGDEGPLPQLLDVEVQFCTFITSINGVVTLTNEEILWLYNDHVNNNSGFFSYLTQLYGFLTGPKFDPLIGEAFVHTYLALLSDELTEIPFAYFYRFMESLNDDQIAFLNSREDVFVNILNNYSNDLNETTSPLLVQAYLDLAENDMLALDDSDLFNKIRTFLIDYEFHEDPLALVDLMISWHDDNDDISMDRAINVYNYLEEDSDRLVEDCGDLTDWFDLANFIPPPSVVDRLDELGEAWKIQWIGSPTLAPRINLDYFSTTISEMPIKDEATGERWEPSDLFDHFRKEINSFAEGSGSVFNPYSPQDEIMWSSDNPLGAVISIDISLPGTNVGDDGSVICSQHENCCWIFSTLKAPAFPLTEDGFHPVSGNRQFGYTILPDGSMEIFTKGVDRFLYLPDEWEEPGSTSLIAYIGERLAFAGADGLWSDVQDNIKSFVDSKGGSSNVNTPIKKRPVIEEAFMQLFTSSFPEPLTKIPCD